VKKRNLMAAVLGIWAAGSALGQVDYRAQQSSVKDQGARGTCAAFAICAAMETFPGVPTDLSEQMLYASIKLRQNNMDLWRRAYGISPTMQMGDTFESYATLASTLGTCPEWFFPYNPNPLVVPASVPEEVRRYIELAQVTPQDLQKLREAVGVWRVVPAEGGMLSGAAACDVERIKAELDAGRVAIPVGYRVHESSWSEISRYANFDGSGVRDVIHPGMMDRFARRGGDWMSYNQAKAACMAGGEDLLDGLGRGLWVRERAFSDAGYGGHAVTIVGYDAVGFIIKNSWGSGWGTGGYARIGFDYHSLYATEAMLIDRVELVEWPRSSLQRTSGIRDGKWRLKVQPVAGERGDSWELSSWALEAGQPQAQVVEYTVLVYHEGAGWTRAAWWSVLKGAEESWNGFPLRLSGEEYARVASAKSVTVSVRYGYFSLDDPTRMDEAVFVGRREYGPIDIGLRAAVDFMARIGR